VSSNLIPRTGFSPPIKFSSSHFSLFAGAQKARKKYFLLTINRLRFLFRALGYQTFRSSLGGLLFFLRQQMTNFQSHHLSFNTIPDNEHYLPVTRSVTPFVNRRFGLQLKGLF
jgi:hypothetical protein